MMAAIDAGLERVSRTRRKRQDLLIETTPLRVRDNGIPGLGVPVQNTAKSTIA
jgi:hypothetical protein